MTRWSPARGVARAAIASIELYRNMISPYRPPSCRFTPTCSQYAVDALRGHGLFCASALAILRLAKCGPWHRGGWDPIPEPRHHHRLIEAGTSETDGAATLRSDLRV